MTVPEVMASLRTRYQAPAWAFFEEVRDSTGWASRTADALAFGLWPSQGLELLGFEVKAYRGDWLRELKHPEKADRILGFADRVFLVTTEKGLIRRDELPPLWGLVEPHGTALRATKAAEKNPQARPLDRHFFASLMRQAHSYIEREIQNADRTKEAHARGLAEGKQEWKTQLQLITEDRDRLQRALDRFYEASGVEIDKWDGSRIGQAVKTVLESRGEDFEGRLRRVRDDIDKALQNINVSAA